MKTKNILISFVIIMLVGLIAIALWQNPKLKRLILEDRNVRMTTKITLSDFMTEEQYQSALKTQEKLHALIREGRAYEKKGDNKIAIEKYSQALQITKGYALEGMVRSRLAECYEDIGDYKNALEQVEEILRLQISDIGRNEVLQQRERLLKKIEE